MVDETITVTDPITLQQTQQTVQRPQPLTTEQLDAARNNLNYQKAAVVVEHLSALGLSSTLNLNSIVLMLNGGSSIELREDV
jgi:hypothetical protein